MASELMGAFRTPSCYDVRPKESGGSTGEMIFNPGGEIEGDFFSAKIISDEGSSGGPSPTGIAGAEGCVEPTGVAATPASSSFPLHPSCCHSGTELNHERAAKRAFDLTLGSGDLGGGDSFEASWMGGHLLSEGVVEEADEHDISSADWLAATHALLDVGHEPG